MGLLDDIRGLLTPKPAVVPDPFDRQANAAIPIMGASEILPNMVGRITGSPMAEFAAGFLSPSSWIKQPKKLDIFVGKKGIKNLGLDDVLEKARQMEKAGKSRDEIWEATAQMAAKKGVPGGGIGRGVDKQWRFELDDSTVKLKQFPQDPMTPINGKLGDTLDHPYLYQAHPDMQNVPLVMEHNVNSRGGGYYSPNDDRIFYDAMDPDNALSGLMHEGGGHAIQQREGFAMGGSPDLFPMGLYKNDDVARQDLKAAIDNRNKIARRLQKAKPENYESVKRQLMDAETDIINARESAFYSPNEAYRHLAGEAEARLTQSRMNMTPLDRQMFPPWSQKELGGYDVPEAQQIVRFGDGPAMSTGRPRNHLGQEIPPTPYELAHAEAQRVAALPVEQGGLGLPPGNTAMERARAMYPEKAYHGSYDDITAFDPSLGGKSGFGNSANTSDFTTLPDVANQYAMRENAYGNVVPGGAVYPVNIDPTGFKRVQKSIHGDDWMRADAMASTTDAHGMRFKNTTWDSVDEIKNDQFKVLDPSRIRSRFAAFNPAKRDSADLLAGLAPWALPVGATLLGGSFLLPPEEY